MNDNNFYNEDQNTAEEPHVSSVEYGPYGHSAYYERKKKSRGTASILIACAVILLVVILVILATAGALFYNGIGGGYGGGNGSSQGETQTPGGATRPEYNGNVIIYVTDGNVLP